MPVVGPPCHDDAMTDPVSASAVLDVVLALVVLGIAVHGWRQGILAGGLGLVGAVGGGALGLWGWSRLAPRSDLQAAGWPVLLLALVVPAGALLGAALLGGLGEWLRPHRGSVVRGADRVLGAAGALVVVVLVLGTAVAAVRPVAPDAWGRAIDVSRVAGGLEAALPAPLRATASGLGRVLKDVGFPRAYTGPTPEPVLSALAPDPTSTDAPGVRTAASSVVKVSSVGCGGELLGSGWVSSNERVVTNAHVVAGGSGFRVQPEGRGRTFQARLVTFDPELDLAVLYVPGLTTRALPTAAAMADQAPVVVAGFPGGGPSTLVAGRISGTLEATGEDIYGQPGTTRRIYALRVTVEHGNSGGPVLTPDGAVAGTVFARSASEAGTGYALTTAQTADAVHRAAAEVAVVPSGVCAAD